MAERTKQVAELSADKSELLGLLLSEEGAEFNSFPLSFAQQRLWFLEQLEPGSAAYNVPAAVRLRGRLNVAALAQSLTEIARRHETLRTTFAAVDGQPVQIVAAAQELQPEFTDLGELPQAERETLIARLAVEEAQRPFDLSAGPLVRVRLLRLGAEEHVALLTMHHIISDGWSMGLLIKELGVLYDACARGAASPLGELPVQYADFAQWQRDSLRGTALDEQLAYWRDKLAGAPALELPTDRPRPAVQTFRGAKQPLAVGAPLAAALEQLGGRHGATLHMTLLAAFKTLLCRYTGQRDIVVGTPVAGRDEVELEELIGLFVNTLVLRTDLTGDPTFSEALRRVREVALDAYAHQHVPFERLVEELHPERDLSRNPLFQVCFILQNAPTAALELQDLTISPVRFDGGVSKFDLTLALEQGAGGLTGTVEYNSDLFDAATVERMAAHYVTLLEAAVADPSRRISELALLSERERETLLVEWNATRADFPRDRCLHELFEAQVERTPDAVAVVCEEKTLTYGELNARANQLARRLRAQGAGPESRVGIYVERSLEMMAALLGVLKAGGAYVPLDPSYPRERLSLMIADAGLSVLLTQPQLADRLPAGDARVLRLDADWDTFAAEETTNLARGARPDNAAYVIYTSGSTGKPKGVMVTHRNAVNFCAAMDACVERAPQPVWLAVTSISFDISVLELLWTLARGFKVVLQTDDGAAAEEVGAADRETEARPMDFSLFYFASAEDERAADKYRLLLEGARFADRHGFAAVWTPERHFHAFGGLYPNPAVTSAAIAAITERVQIRAGSVVLPLHSPIRVAEEWSVVDNISRGRVAVSFASGWHANDFVLAPENYAGRKEIMLKGIETVRALWRGEAVVLPNGVGKETSVRILPRPVQPELPVWLTAAGNPETFQTAGETGAHLLTHLLGQTPEELAQKIEVYRAAWRRARPGGGEGRVTLMLHTFVGEDVEAVRERVRVPFINYLRTSLDLVRNLARQRGVDIDAQDFTAEQLESLLANAFDRYFETSSLFGTPATCLRLINKLKAIGVDEVACLIDFGVEVDAVIEGLTHLDQLRARSNRNPDEHAPADYSVPAQIARHAVTHMQCTPSMAKMLTLDARGAAALKSLRQLLIGGEALPLPLARQLKELTAARLRNMYGPTETTIWSATHPLDAIAQVVPIGRPVANTALYILDASLRPVPVGVPGDLYIGGEGVVRGYLNRPDLTAEKFIADPFGGVPGARLYKTGDVARYLEDGSVEFLGRSDQQVKVRGFRIEAGEIETALAAHAGVREAVIVAREDVPGEKYLAAYFVAVGDGAPAPAELRRHLKEKLPEYMIPAAFVSLAALPLTPNGKVDRQALPAPDHARLATDALYVAPRTPVEEVLAGIWAQIFRADKIGVDDNFFELGGHSLLATQVIARTRDTFQVELPVQSLFKTPTVAGLAAGVETALRAGQGVKTPPLVRAARDRALPLSFGQQRLWFIDQFDRGNALYNVPMALRLNGALDVNALERALNEIVRRHEVLRTTYHEDGGQPVQSIAASLKLALPLADLSRLPPDERARETRRLTAEEARRTFDLARGPVLRARLLRLAAREHVVLLTTHHIVNDAWTKGIFVFELAEIYKAFAAGAPSPLAELEVQYADYAVWQREWLRGATLQTQIDYWKGQLAGAPPLLELLPARPRPAVQSFRGATLKASLPRELRAQLEHLSRQERVTLFMTLLAAFQTLMHRYSGQADVVVGTNVANRNRVETEKLIGFFVNHLVMRTDLSGDPTFGELLARVREVSLGAYAHQDLPFDQLVKALNPKRNPAYHPLFQILLVLQNAPTAVVELPELSLRPVEQDDEMAQFDLALFVEETDAGLTLVWRYSTDLFDAGVVTRLSDDFARILESVGAQPGARLSELPVAAAAARAESEAEAPALEVKAAALEVKATAEAKPNGPNGARKSVREVRRKAVDLSRVQLVESGHLAPGADCPLVFRPATADVDLKEWVRANRALLEAELLKHGALLFRDFHVGSTAEFEGVARATGTDLFDEYGDLPREEVDGKIYGSTPYPADQAILFHNESSHMHRWPRKIFFHCVKAAERGGETPIVDCRKVYERLDPAVRERFRQKGITYVRNYTDGIDVSWQSFFRTTRRAAVEDYCRSAGVEFEWKKDNHLRTRQQARAITTHPLTGEPVFFNQLQLHHVSCLEPNVRRSLQAVFAPEDLPRNVYYGDGAPIEDEVIAHVGEIYRRAAVSFPWRAGDILMLDNMLTAHSRNPFVGTRKIVVAMGEIVSPQAG
jgi:natural product biosynthesis luciferase-like monooxygenase protein